MARRGEFYTGSQLLQTFVPVIGLPLDQLNFLVCQLLSLLLAFPFNRWLSPLTTPPSVRLWVELTVGLVLVIFCFGHQVWYLIGQSLVSYLLMKYGNPSWSQRAVFAFCMLYLSLAHILRQFYDYGGYTLDITGPMMIQTQKLTSLAFSLSDGHRKPSDLSPDQRTQAIKEVPDLLRFYSYMFYFHGIMCGPFAFYFDYMAFIEGTYLQRVPACVLSSSSSSNGHTAIEEITAAPSERLMMGPVGRKLLTALVCGGLMISLPSLCNPEMIKEEAFFEKNAVQMTAYIFVCMAVTRQKYYFAWALGESVNLAAGFGFSGYDDQGQPKWDLMENVSIWDQELGNSLKVNIDSWNKQTLVWLRKVVYDRAPAQRTMVVFAISAFWHGFYPGYYFTFATAALFTMAARLIRRNVRPWFLTSPRKKQGYDAMTFIMTRLAIAYLTAPFVALELVMSMRLFLAQYLWLHIAAVAVIVYFKIVDPLLRPARHSTPHQKQH